jgi:peptidoglycan/LPS O-acetylase OafA/YrhL
MTSQTATAGAPPATAEAGSRLIAVDALRGLAALGVVTFHSAPTGHLAWWMGILKQDLDLGVMVFFTISGALIAAPFIAAMVDGRRRPSLGNFAIRRAARIFPAYWVALLGYVVVAQGFAWWQPLAHGLLLMNVLPGQINQLIYPAWTVEVEVSFYIALAVTAWVVFRRNRRVGVDAAGLVVLGLWVASLLVTFVADQVTSPLTSAAEITKYTFPAQLAYICPGLLLALAGTRAARERGRWWAWLDRLFDRPWLLAGVIALFIAGGMVMTAGVFNVTVRDLHREPFAVAAGLLVGGALRHERSLRPVTRLILPVGLITYSLYLWHVVVIHALRDVHIYPVHAGMLSWPLTWLLLVSAAVAVGAVSYLFVERPALRWSINRSQLRALGSEKPEALLPHVGHGEAVPDRGGTTEPEAVATR